MSKCPSGNKLRRWMREGGESPASLRAHFQECERCRRLLAEEKRLDLFFQSHYQPAEPPAFLWPRIEQAIQTGARPPLSWQRPVWQSGWLRHAAAWAGLAILSGAGFFAVRHLHSQRTLLGAIDSGYEATLEQLRSLDENPFSGDTLPAVTRDGNPFLSGTLPDLEEPVEGGVNPFTTIAQ